YEEEMKKVKKEDAVESTLKMGIPTSSLVSEISSSKRTRQSSAAKPSPKKRKRLIEENEGQGSQVPSAVPIESPKPQRKRKSSEADKVPIATDSALRQPSIIGTTSSKLSYLLEQILRFHHDEKILVFYDGDNTAYYIAQCLELLHIVHLIYAKSLPSER